MNFNYEEDDLSVKELLIKYKLADEEGELLASDALPPADWGLGPYDHSECMIYLCTLVHFFKEKGMIENLDIAIDKSSAGYEILIHEKDRKYLYPYPSFNWGVVMDTIEHLFHQMAGSNQTYLANQLFFNT